ncbi:Anaphase-promoting complex subunit 4 [Mortierella sp. GBA43]|nr:Anaphase-promoting complex subunit 4 [Mortierella sp. GBA43]
MALSDYHSSPSPLNASFDHYAENQFPALYKLEAWSPTADLLALVTDENKLELFRLSWKQHWSIPVRGNAATSASTTTTTNAPRIGFGALLQALRAGPTASTPDSAVADVVSLAWRPDGKMIAVGLGNGHVTAYDYKDGSVAFTMAYPTGGDTQSGSLRQQQMMAALSKHRSFLQNKAKVMEPVPVIPSDVDDVDEESSGIMNVLFAGDNQGSFRLRLFGIFDVNPIPLLKLMEAYGVNSFKAFDILDADIQLDLSEFVIVASGTQHHGQTSAAEKHVLRITLTSELLEKRPREIRILGLKKRAVNSLTNYLADCLRVMQADYRDIRRTVEDCLEKAQQFLDDNGEVTTPMHEFMQLLMTGRPTLSMDQYMQTELGRQGIKSWMVTSKAAYTNIQRTAFECLLPACERLLIHLSDILGCSRWTDRYKILQLEETQVYNCIKIAGDFVGAIERLFLAMKTEIKNFQEFCNWLSHVMEAMQPSNRNQDGEDENKLPPVDVLAVSEYLKSALSNKGLEDLFKDSDADTEADENADGSNISVRGSDIKDSSSRTLLLSTTTEEDIEALGYRSTPSYPILFSFSEELQAVVGNATRKPSAPSAPRQFQPVLPQSLSSPSPTPPPPAQNKKDTNPFAGAAMAAALANSGFGSLMSKKPAPSDPQQQTLPLKGNNNSNIPPSIGRPRTPPSPSAAKKKERPQLTLEAHLKLMTRQCQAIFETPEEAVTKSVRVVHALGMIECGDGDSRNSTSDGGVDVASGTSSHLKLATRYCYHGVTPWHYLVLYLSPSAIVTEPFLCVLRARRKPFVPQSGSSSSVAMDQASDTSFLQLDPVEPKAGQKRRREADESPLNPALSLLSHKGRKVLSHGLGLRETPPTIENLTIHSPSPQLFDLSQGDNALLVAESYDRSDREDSAQMESARGKGTGDVGLVTSGEQDFEAVFFSLRDQSREDDGSEEGGGGGGSFYDIQDVTFLDDDHLGMILSSSSSTSGTTSTSPAKSTTTTDPNTSTDTSRATPSSSLGDQQDQFLVSIPLHSPECPYQDLSSHLPEMALSGIESLDSGATLGLLEKLAAIFETETTASAAAGSSSDSSAPPPPPRLMSYPLPISRSREVGFSGGGGGGGQSGNDPTQVTTLGPYRIASNEREMKRLISVHGYFSTPKNTMRPRPKTPQQDLGTHITVFEL